MPSRNVEYLRENGPAPIDDLPNQKVTLEDRMNGVWVFKSSGLANPSKSPGPAGASKAVYYLRDDHDLEAVIDTWRETNGSFVDDLPRQAIRQRLRSHGTPFYDAIDAIFPPGGEA